MKGFAAHGRVEDVGTHKEKPGAMRNGPPITVTCQCGQRQRLTFGDSWTCADCGLTWRTGQIPAEQFARIRRTQLTFRLLPIALGLAVATLAAFFVVSGNGFSLFVLIPSSLILWMTFIRPIHRRRYRAAIGSLPSWRLQPERARPDSGCSPSHD